MNSLISLDELTFENLVKEEKELIIINFSAEWCGPCQSMMPVLDQFEKETEIKVGKVNIDEEEELAQEFRVMGVPTFIVMKDGKMVDQKVGPQSLETLKEMVEAHK